MSNKQFFTSYLCAIGHEPDNDVLSWLPGVGDGELFHSNLTRLYVCSANSNDLHQVYVDHKDDFIFFICGEFYSETTLSQIKHTVENNALDELRLNSFLGKLNGVFSGIIVNTMTGNSWAFTDRFGFGLLYYSSNGNEHTFCSHLWPLIKNPATHGGIDVEALQQTLVGGYPLGNKTAYKNIEVILPGTVRISGRGIDRTLKYYTPPDETEELSLADATARLYEAFKAHFTSVAKLTKWSTYGLAMSGGHDSRVIMNAMIASGNKPICVSGYSGVKGGDVKRALEACEISGCESHSINYAISNEQELIDTEIIVDGSGTGSWTLNLSKAIAEDGAECTYYGTTGDVLSGGWHIDPCKYENIEKLANEMFHSYNYEYTTPLPDFMKLFPSYDPDQILHEFSESFTHDAKSLHSAYLIHRIQHRNFRRIRMFMQGSYLHSTPVHFFHDTRVADAYISLPLRHLKAQQAHVRACYYAVPQLGKLPASNYHVPVSLEPALLPLIKTLLPEAVRHLLKKETGKNDVRPDDTVMQTLRDRSFGRFVDVDLLESLISNDGKGALLSLRCAYVARMLDPASVCNKSGLMNHKEFINKSL